MRYVKRISKENSLGRTLVAVPQLVFLENRCNALTLDRIIIYIVIIWDFLYYKTHRRDKTIMTDNHQFVPYGNFTSWLKLIILVSIIWRVKHFEIDKRYDISYYNNSVSGWNNCIANRSERFWLLLFWERDPWVNNFTIFFRFSRGWTRCTDMQF